MRAPLRIVAIGGGTGLSALLHGLKHSTAPVDITAVVTVTDDGGSSGRLRREFDILPPGDIRNCMVALSEDETLLSRLFQYRFQAGSGLKGHSFGNLFLTALAHITGDFALAVKQSSEVLKIRGHIFPSTSSNVELEAVLEDGSLVYGETKISRSRRHISTIRLRPRGCKPLQETVDAIAAADLITLGPGSLFTSVIPNLLVSGIPEAIRASRATKAYFVNLMWQPGETTRFRASDHIRAIHQHAGGKLIDVAVVNCAAIRPAARRRYAREQADPVENDLANIRAMGVKVVQAELVLQTEVVRHDPRKSAVVALRLGRANRRRNEAAGAQENNL
jgi:uncharacterized cofD-like protein